MKRDLPPFTPPHAIMTTCDSPAAFQSHEEEAAFPLKSPVTGILPWYHQTDQRRSHPWVPGPCMGDGIHRSLDKPQSQSQDKSRCRDTPSPVTSFPLQVECGKDAVTSPATHPWTQGVDHRPSIMGKHTGQIEPSRLETGPQGDQGSKPEALVLSTVLTPGSAHPNSQAWGPQCFSQGLVGWQP